MSGQRSFDSPATSQKEISRRLKVSLRKLTVSLALVAALFATTIASAQHAAKGTPDKDKTPLSAIEGSGQQVAVDAKGKLRQPTREELEVLTNSLASKLSQTVDESKIQRKPDGTLSVFAGDSFTEFMLIKTNADGTTTTRCVENMKQAREFFGLDTPKAEEKKNQPKRDANGLETE
jgi:hypothetical protein